jgi:ElaB/YqjD/DUF883 family membrane-anchored ribosome-binding protein
MSKIADNISKAKGAAKTAGTSAKRSATAAVDKGKAAASRSVESSKAFARKTGDTTRQTVEQNPLAIVAGGIALGAIAGMLLPVSKREGKALGKAGKKINKAAKQAAEAAKAAGKERIDALGINQDALRAQFRDLVGKAGEAVKAAGIAAAEETRKKAD